MKPTIIVTGATGQQGSAVISHLPRRFHVKALTRDPNKPEAKALSAQGIEVVSMRNKVNRLEEIFMRLVDGRQGARP